MKVRLETGHGPRYHHHHHRSYCILPSPRVICGSAIHRSYESGSMVRAPFDNALRMYIQRAKPARHMPYHWLRCPEKRLLAFVYTACICTEFAAFTRSDANVLLHSKRWGQWLAIWNSGSPGVCFGGNDFLLFAVCVYVVVRVCVARAVQFRGVPPRTRGGVCCPLLGAVDLRWACTYYVQTCT
ncbi:hypothetical protein BDY21DRAFT_359078 [Lineolata rhizophorae]|uniref:Uncharacterized protein n=1 Tax=Lineolata rhizophorae TaxID=578093 RepID=A0A6A6NME2_9PEZI|nr:hypothetical protein BDY21DRAFT_359078 [Lineolata rhizophorae]